MLTASLRCVYFFKCSGAYNCRQPGACGLDLTANPLQCESHKDFTPLAEVPIKSPSPEFLVQLRGLPRSHTPLTNCSHHSRGFLCVHARTHRRNHACTRTRAPHGSTCKHAYTCTYTYTHTTTHTHPHALTHPSAQVCTSITCVRTYTHTHSCIHARALTCTRPHTHAYTCPYSHTCMHRLMLEGGECDDGYWRFGGVCQKCTALFEEQAFFSVCIMIFLFFGWFKLLSVLARIVPSLSHIIPYLQMLVVVGGFDLPWGDSLNAYFSAFSIFFLNFDLTVSLFGS